MAVTYLNRIPGQCFQLGSPYYTGASNVALSATSSRCGWKIFPPNDTSVTDVYVYVVSKVGAPGALTLEIWPRKSNTIQIPDTSGSPLATTNLTPTADTWIHWQLSSPVAVTTDTFYWISVKDPAGGAGANWTVKRTGFVQPREPADGALTEFCRGFSSSDSWTTSNTDAWDGAVVVKYADGSLHGCPYVFYNSPAANTPGINFIGRRGIRIDTDDNGMEFFGCTTRQGVNNLNRFFDKMEVYAGGTNPGGSTLATRLSTNYNMAGTPYTDNTWRIPVVSLAANSSYRIVINNTDNANQQTTLIQMQQTGSPPVDVAACGFYGGRAYYTYESGGTWVDDPYSFPQMGFGFARLRAVTVQPPSPPVSTPLQQPSPFGIIDRVRPPRFDPIYGVLPFNHGTPVSPLHIQMRAVKRGQPPIPAPPASRELTAQRAAEVQGDGLRPFQRQEAGGPISGA